MGELLPQQALRLESLRRALFDMHLSWGYQPVDPPFVEFLDSLLSGTGRDYERQTFKLTDPLSGQMMGVRADMTPQVARIDAHQMDESVARLFYLGTVVRAHAEGVEKNRTPLQFGAEIFGHAGPQSDVEVIRLMIASLRSAGIEDIHLDLGHTGIFSSLCERMNLEDTDRIVLFGLLQKKAASDIESFAARLGLDPAVGKQLCKLCKINGDASVLDDAIGNLSEFNVTSDKFSVGPVAKAIEELRQISDALSNLPSSITMHFDLAEVRGYQYHTGVVFAAYTPGAGSEIARGGRYDGIGRSFGRARPATGYSTDLKLLMRLIGDKNTVANDANRALQNDAILCPGESLGQSSKDAPGELQDLVDQLRAQGEVVVFDLDGLDHSNCNRVLTNKTGAWVVENISVENL